MKRSERRALVRTASQPSDACVGEVDGQGAGDVVGAVPEGLVGRGAGRVLPDPERPGHLVEVLPADGMERAVSHRRPRAVADAIGRASGGTARRTRRGRRSGRTPPPPRPEHPPAVLVGARARSPRAARGSPSSSMNAVGERLPRTPAATRRPRPSARRSRGVGVGRRHDRLAGAHRVRQGPGHDLVEVRVRGDEDVRGLEPRPELHASDEPVDEPDGVGHAQRRRRAASRRSPVRLALAPEQVRVRGAQDHVQRRRDRPRRRRASPRSRTRSPCRGRAARSSGSPSGPRGRAGA